MTKLENQILLSFLEKSITVSEKVINEILDKSTTDNSDGDFFSYHFYKRAIDFAKSINCLIKEKYNHEASIVARNLLEGLIYYVGFMGEKNIATRWRRYGIYENFRMIYLKNNQKELNNLLKEYKIKFGEKAIKESISLFDYKKRCDKWSNIPIDEIIKNNPDLLGKIDKDIYVDLSKVLHWTPKGVIAGNSNGSIAIVITFLSLLRFSKYINSRYELGFEDEIEKIINEFLESH